MIDPALPTGLEDIVADLQRRLTSLERSPQLISSSVNGGVLRVLDDSGNKVFEAGKLSAGVYGVRISDAAGATIFYATGDGQGLGTPRRATPWRKQIASDYESTTSATFVTAWDSRVGVVESHGLTLGGGPLNFNLQVRRSAGSTAAINVYEPHPLEQTTGVTVSATSGGLTAS